MHDANYMFRDGWWRESDSEEGSVPDPGSKLDDYPDPGSELDDYPDSDSELVDYDDDSDLSASADAGEDPDPDGPEAEIRAIFNMHNPTTLFAGRVTGRPDQMAATGPPPSTQPQPPHHAQQPGPPLQPAQPQEREEVESASTSPVRCWD